MLLRSSLRLHGCDREVGRQADRQVTRRGAKRRGGTEERSDDKQKHRPKGGARAERAYSPEGAKEPAAPKGPAEHSPKGSEKQPCEAVK